MSAGDYFRDNQGRLLFHLTGMGALSVFLLLTDTAGGIVTIILIVWVLGLILALAVDFARQRKRLEELWAILDGLPQKYLFMECAPKPHTEYERGLYQIMRTAGKSMIGEVSAVRRQQKDYREYIENWVHEIKVPITAIRLICENNRGDTTRKIMPQLAQIEEQVERSLYYARSEQVERDFVIRRTTLAAVVDAALAKYRTLLIQNGVCVETKNLDIPVYTDAKWLEFIIGQMLSNSVKYCGEQPVITIAAVNDADGTRLCITDNGIGIPAAELPRIFDKGFTGSNGRLRGGATGMGLYLCKKLTAHLNVDLSAKSVENEYTSMILYFSAILTKL